jgi:hypothetical protein
MILWIQWYSCVQEFQASCSRDRSFVYLVLVLVAFSIRQDLAGVTSFIRALCMPPRFYPNFLHFFNYSTALDLSQLTSTWCRIVRTRLPVHRVGPYEVYVADGLKMAKEGKKMPGVKTLHQPSQNNSKPPYIMGHSFQSLALLVRNAQQQVAAIPLATRLHEGIAWFPSDRRTLLDKLVQLFDELPATSSSPILLVADAYYASQKVVLPLLKNKHQLLTRVRSNAVAYHKAPLPQKPRRGRPKVYGKKVQLRTVFQHGHRFRKAASPVYGETKVELSYWVQDLLWKPIGQVVRFVWVIHPTRGQMILMCTDCTIDPLTLIETYGYRFKIEVGFRSAIHQIGAYGYHFWMKEMKPIRRKEGTQYLHKKSHPYRKAVKQKLEAYHRFVQLGCIAQGLLIYLSFSQRATVWENFRSWLRTMNPEKLPSELVVSSALRSSLFEFLRDSPEDQKLREILTEHMEIQQMQEYQIAA